MQVTIEKQLDEAMMAWMTRRRFSPDPQTNAKIRRRVSELTEQTGVLPSVSMFERSYLELCNEKAIAPFRGTALEHQDTPAINADVVSFIERASAFELRRRYANDKEFRRQYDEYAAVEIRKKAEPEQAGFTLSVEEYNSLPTATIVRNYRSNPQWKRAIDDLAAKGLI